MKKLLYSFLILSSATLFAQQKLAIADNMIGTEALFNSKGSSMQLVKAYNSGTELPANLKKFSSVFTNGVTEYKSTGGTKLSKITLASLNKQKDLPANSPVFINDYKFTDSSTMISTEMPATSKIKEYNGKPTLYISTK